MIELEDEKIRWPKKLVERLVEKGGGQRVATKSFSFVVPGVQRNCKRFVRSAKRVKS